MAIWIPPGAEQRIEDEKFEKARKKYIAKNGVTIRIPGLRDIVNIPVFEPLTLAEKEAWKKGDKSFFSSRRYEDIRLEKERRRERYIAILSSPQPRIFRSRAELATSIDNVQDATSTLAVLGAITLKALPRLVAKSTLGPIGWIMEAATLMNMASTVLSPEIRARKSKRFIERTRRMNHTSTTLAIKSSQIAKISKVSRFNIIEGLQTTKDVFGVGLTLGSIMSLPLDLVFGAAAYMKGQKVNISLPVPQLRFYELLAMKTLKGALNLLTSPFVDTKDLFLTTMHALPTAFNIIHDSKWLWNAVDRVSNPAGILMTGANPRNFLTDEVIEETHASSKSKPDYLNYEDSKMPADVMVEQYSDIITEKLDKFFDEQKYTQEGFNMSQIVTQTALQAARTMSDDGQVQIDTRPSVKFCIDLLENGMGFAQMNRNFLPRAPLRALESLDSNLDIYNFREAFSIVSRSSRNALIPFQIKTIKEYNVYDSVTLIGRKETLKIHEVESKLSQVRGIIMGWPDLRTIGVQEFRRREAELLPSIEDRELVKSAQIKGVQSGSVKRTSSDRINELASLQERFRK